MKIVLVFAALLVPAFAIASQASPPRPPPSHPDCLDARAITRARAIEGASLLIAAGAGRFRLDVDAACAPPDAHDEPHLLADHGWVCGTGNEFVRYGEALCAIQTLTRLTLDDYVAIAREHDRSRLGARPDQAALEPVQVTASAARRSFRGDAEYCFAPSAVRAWNTRDDGLVVETSPRRAGGFRWYKVELSRACKDIHWTRTVEFRSGMGLGIICGNAGDEVVMRSDEVTEPALRADPRTTAASFGTGCPIAMVYPIE